MKDDVENSSPSECGTYDVQKKSKTEVQKRVAIIELKARKNHKRNKQTMEAHEVKSADDSTTVSSENILDRDYNNKVIKKLEIDSDSNKSFILDKFLQSSPSSNTEFVMPAVPPVPKPRKKKQNKTSPPSSQGTYDIQKPVVLGRVQNKDIAETLESNDNSQKKNNIGAILLHTSPTNHSVRTVSYENGGSSSSNNEKQINSIEEKRNYTNSNKRINEKIEVLSTSHDNFKDKNNVVPLKRSSKQKKKEQSSSLIKNYKEDLQSSKIQHYSYEYITEIIIHKTDRLQLNSLVVHPLVKIHIVDIRNGNYFPKSDEGRSVVHFYENKEFAYISPILTYPYNLQEHRSMYPAWEETILINEDFEYFVKESKNIIIFFEVIDFLASSGIQSLKKGWHKIAFAFLKIAGGNNTLNLQSKLRLQLYKPIEEPNKFEPTKCPVWFWWWNKKKMKKYDSTLYVSIKKVISPEKVISGLRSKTPIQKEKSTKNLLFDEELVKAQVDEGISSIKSSLDKLSANDNNSGGSNKKWSRLPHETLKFPNKILHRLPTCSEGCFVLKFSNNGLNLACSLCFDDTYTLVVYSVETFKEVRRFPCHQGLIYSIDWSKDDSIIIMASSDNFVSVWNFRENKFLQILPHPSYVYIAQLSQDFIIATGCYDKQLRIWSQSNDINFSLTQEISGHKGYITSLIFGQKSALLYSADSVGGILQWTKEDDKWTSTMDISIYDLKNIVINQIMLISKERRLVVHSRDSILRIVDIKSSCVIHWLHGSLNRRIQTYCTISPCGNFVSCGSENGIIIIWHCKTGKLVASYSLEHGTEPIHCVQFHPEDHMLAFSNHGTGRPVFLACYDEEVNGNLLGLTILDEKLTQKSLKIKNSSMRAQLGSGDEKDAHSRLEFKELLSKIDQMIHT